MLPLHDAPAYRLYRVQRLLRAHLLGILAASQLSPEQYFVLMRLAESGAVVQGELGDPELDDRASVSRQVTGLERRGLVTRSAHPEDGRAALVRLTPEGAALVSELQPAVLEERTRLFGELPPDDLASFHRVLSHLEARLQAAR